MRSPIKSGSALKARCTCGFTLVEVLVAIAVLILLLTIVLQITQGSMATWREADMRFKNFVIARSVLESISGDFDNAVSGVNLEHIGAASTPTKLQLFTRRRGIDPLDTGTLRPLTFVSYYADAGQLWRAEKSYSWNDRGDFTSATTPDPSGAASLCDGVLAFRFAFPDDTGNYNRVYAEPNGEAPRAVMLSMAIVGADVHRVLSESGGLNELEQTLNGLAEGNEGTAVAAWNSWLEADADIPGNVRQNIRFVQRVFPLPDTASAHPALP